MVKRRAHTAAGNAPAAWKKSPLVGVILGVVIVVSLVYLVLNLSGSGDGITMPDNFPRAYLAAEDNGKYEAVMIKRGPRETAVPFTENNKEYWEAYTCGNEICPGRKDGKPFIFAYVHEKAPAAADNGDPAASTPPDYMRPAACPLCKEAAAKAKKNKEKYDLYSASRYQTKEAEAMIAKIREEYKKRNGN